MIRKLLFMILIPVLSFSQVRSIQSLKKITTKEEMILSVYTRETIWYMNVDRNMLTNSENQDTLYFKDTDKMFSYVAKKTLETINFEKVKKVQDSILKRPKKCKHKRKTLRVLHTFCTVEVTAVFCEKCGKQLTKEEWKV